MKTFLVAMSSKAFADREPPSEFRLWHAGDNPTDYGVHKWTARSVAEVLASYEKRGNPILVDVEHGGPVSHDGEPRTTAGYAKLEIREGEPWLVFSWSDYAAEQIRTGQRRFLSPEYLVDKETHEIVEIARVSLVAEPGTHNARLLASAKGRSTMLDPVIHAALKAALSAEDPKASIEALLKELEDAGSGGDDGADMSAAGEPAVASAQSGDGNPKEGEQAVDAAAPPAPDAGKDPQACAAGKPAAADAAGATQAAADVAGATQAVAASSATAVTVGEAALAAVAKDVDAVRVEVLLAAEGHRLTAPVRAWAKSQPHAIVKGLVDASPAAIQPPARIAATRGRNAGVHAARTEGLVGSELAEFNKLVGRRTREEMETFMTSGKVTDSEDEFGPHVRSDGTLRITGTAGEWKRQETTRIAAAAAAGKGH